MQTRGLRSSQLRHEPLATPRRTTRSQRTVESASESSAGEEPFIPSSLAELSTPTAARRTRTSQRASQNAYSDNRLSQRAMRRAGQSSHVQLREHEDEAEDVDVTPRAHTSQTVSQAFAARDRRQSLNFARPPTSARSDRSSTHPRFSELTARLPSSSPAPRVRRSLGVRASIGPHQAVSEMGLARRAELVAGVAGDCIVKLLRWSAGPDQQALARNAFETLFRNRQTYIFSPHAPPFPDLHATMEALAPSMKTSENLTILGSALQKSNLAMWLYTVVQPDAAGEMLMAGLENDGENLLSVAADRKGKGRQSQVEADMESTARRVRMRNELLVFAWKRFWFVVLSKEDRENESALTLWLDLGSFIALNWRRPSLDPLSRPSSSLPDIPQDLMRTLFSTSAITRYGQWSEDSNEFSEDEEESQALRNGITARWRTLAKRRYTELTEKDPRILDRQFVWSRWQQEALAFVAAEVVDGADLAQGVTVDRPRSVSVKRPLSESSRDSPEKVMRHDREKRPRNSNGTMSIINEDRETSVSAAEADDEGQMEGVEEEDEKEDMTDDLDSERPRSLTPLADDIGQVHSRGPENDADSSVPRGEAQRHGQGSPPEKEANDETYIDFDMFDFVAQEMQDEADQVALKGRADAPSQPEANDRPQMAEDDTIEQDDASEDGSAADDEPFLPPTHIIEQVDQQISVQQTTDPGRADEHAGDDRPQNAANDTDARQPPLFTSQVAAQQQRTFNFAASQAQAERIGWDDELDDVVEVKQEIHHDHNVGSSAGAALQRIPNPSLAGATEDPAQVINGNEDGMISDSDAGSGDDRLDVLDEAEGDQPIVQPPLGATPARQRNTSPIRRPTHTQGLARKRSSVLPDEFASTAEDEDEQDRLLLTRTNVDAISRRSVTPIRFIDETDRSQTVNTEREAEILRQDRQASIFRWNEMLIPPGPRAGGAPDPDDPKGRLRKSFAAHRECELYMVDEHGDELVPNNDYVLPVKFKPLPSNLFFKGKRVDGSRKHFTEAQALLLYRTVQQVPMSEPSPISVVNYLHGEFGLLGQSLAQWNTTMMKDKLLTILHVRKNNAWPIVGRARKYCPKSWPERIEYDEEEQAIADGEEEHAKEMKDETERQVRELAEAKKAEEEAEGGDEDDGATSEEGGEAAEEGSGGEEADEPESEEGAAERPGKAVAKGTKKQAAPAASQKKAKGKAKAKQTAPAKAGPSSSNAVPAKAKVAKAKDAESSSSQSPPSGKAAAAANAKAGQVTAASTLSRSTRSANRNPDAGETADANKRKSARIKLSAARKIPKVARADPRPVNDDVDELDSTDADADDQAGPPSHSLIPASDAELEPAASEAEDEEDDLRKRPKTRRARQMAMVEITTHRTAKKANAKGTLKEPAPGKRGRGRPRKYVQPVVPESEHEGQADDAVGEAGDGVAGGAGPSEDEAEGKAKSPPRPKDPRMVRGFKGAKRGSRPGGFRHSMGSRRSTFERTEGTPTASEADSAPESDDEVAEGDVQRPDTPQRPRAADQPGSTSRVNDRSHAEDQSYAQSDGGDSSFVSHQMDVLGSSPRRGEGETHDAGETQDAINRHVIQQKVMGEVESQ